MEALLVIDVQNVLVNASSSEDTIEKIERLIQYFNSENKPVIFIQHLEDNPESYFFKEKEEAKIINSFQKYIEVLITKTTPSAFYQTDLQKVLEQLDVNSVVVTGFNTEFCCQFTAIAAFDRGFQVTFIEDATNTVNSSVEYEMEGLDIRDFVGTVLHWSNVIEVVDFEEYVKID